MARHKGKVPTSVTFEEFSGVTPTVRQRAKAKDRAHQILKDLESRLAQEGLIVVGEFWSLVARDYYIKLALNWNDDQMNFLVEQFDKQAAIIKKQRKHHQAKRDKTRRRHELIRQAIDAGILKHQEIHDFVKAEDPTLLYPSKKRGKSGDLISPQIMMKIFRQHTPRRE